MKKVSLLLGLCIMMLATLPMSAQSRKDKKAAKKAEWEMQQQQKAEEAALLHKMKMDSIRDAQAARDAAKEAAAKRAAEEEADRQAAKEAAKAEAEYQRSMQTFNLPCWEADTDEYFTAHVQRKMKVNQMTLQSTALLRLAQQQMRQKIEAAYKGVVRDYMDQMDVDDKFSAASHIESAGEAVIQKFVNATKEQCRQVTRPDASGMVTMYLSIRVDKKDMTEDLVNSLSEAEETKVRNNEEKFRKAVEHHFSPEKTQE